MMKNKSKPIIMTISNIVEIAVPRTWCFGININNEINLIKDEIMQIISDCFSIDRAYIAQLIGASM